MATEPPYDPNGPYARVRHPGPYKPLPFQRAVVKSKLDGVDIEIGYWLPNVPAGTRVPVIAVVSPYFTGIGETDSTDMSTPIDSTKPLIENYLPHGYAVAGVSVRGSGYSGGCLEQFGAKETADIGTAMDWLGQAQWSMGKIGVVGVSYDGATAWEAAASGSKFVRTIVPAEGFVDAADLWYRHGRTSLGGAGAEAAFMAWGARYVDPSSSTAALLDRVTSLGCPARVEGGLTYVGSDVTGGLDPLGYWNERNHRAEVEQKYHGSILSTVGQRDDDPLHDQVIPWANKLRALGLTVHQWFGAWDHSFPDGQYYAYHRWDWADYLLTWFDHELKGDASADVGPNVQVQDSTGGWRYEDAFPVADAREFKWVPSASTAASYPLVPLGTQWPWRHNSLGPSPVEDAGRAAGLDAVFDMPVAKDLRFSGIPHLSFSATPIGATGALSAYLDDVARDGTETELGWAMMSLEYRNGTTLQPVVPGERVDATVDFEPTDALVAAGHTLRLRIWEVAPMTSFDARPSPMILNVGPGTATAVALPVITRDGSRSFNPFDTPAEAKAFGQSTAAAPNKPTHVQGEVLARTGADAPLEPSFALLLVALAGRGATRRSRRR